METDYLPVSNDADAYYTISGNKSALTKIDIRRLSMMFSWQEDLLSRVNQHVMAVYQLAFDFTPLTDLDLPCMRLMLPSSFLYGFIIVSS